MNMNRSHRIGVSLVAAAAAFALAPMIHAQDDEAGTQAVRDAENDLERAEERLERAQQAVDEREEALQDAIADAADAADSADDSAERDAEDFGDADWNALTDEHPNLSTFVEALRLTGLEDTLADGTSYTVFAPIDEAFDDPEDLLSEDNREDLIELLRAHIVADDVDPVRVRSLDEALTVDGGTIDLSMDDDTLTVGDAEAVDADIRLGNLRIYPIDGVLDPDPRDTDIALGDFD